MKLNTLRATSKAFKQDVLERYADLFEGGERFNEHLKRYLPANTWEPDDAYKQRLSQAHYLNYCKPIGLYMTALLFSRPLAFDKVPEQYTKEWALDVDGKGTPLETFLRDRFVEALQFRTAWICVSFPKPDAEPRSRAEFDELKLDRPILSPLDPLTVIDWRRDDRGTLLWLKTRVKRSERLEPYDEKETVIETFTIYRVDGSVERWQISYPEDKPPADTVEVPELPAESEPVGGLVELTLPAVLHLMDHLSSPALEHFRARNALAHQIRTNCYEMPWMKLKDANEPPVMGAGYYGILGIDEDIFYPEHGSVPYEVAAEYGRVLKDELHRVTNTMSLGVDNNAAAVGRSGESKQADAKQTEQVLEAFAKVIRAVVATVLKMVGKARGEALEPVIGGMSGYSLPDPKATAETAALIKTLGVRSVTAIVEVMMRTIEALLPDLDHEKKRKIRRELEATTTAEDLIAEDEAMNGEPDPEDPDDDDEPDEE